MSKSLILSSIEESIYLRNLVLADHKMLEAIEGVTSVIVKAFQEGKAVYFCGNGGSAADAQHLSAELSGRYKLERKALPSEALHVNGSFLTAVANDYDFSQVYVRAVEAFCKVGDVLIALSTSGESPNIINAIIKAKTLNVHTIGLTGQQGGKMADICDILIKIPSTNTPRIQECHMMIGHIICEMVELELFS